MIDKVFHVAIIPDGNRRWARAHDLPVWEGHRVGSQAMEQIIDYAYECGVTHLSTWGSSLENMKKRPLRERMELLDVYQEYFTRMIKRLRTDMRDVHVQALGRWREIFPQTLIDLIDKCQETSVQNAQKILTIFLAYSGDDEMVEAVRAIASEGIAQNDITGDTIREHLVTRDLPPVDLMIRTGGEPHLSAGFMMWHMANAQLYFTDKLFPDFLPPQLDEALEDFAKRGRRLGK